jgi:hypothetical protein
LLKVWHTFWHTKLLKMFKIFKIFNTCLDKRKSLYLLI